MAHKSINLEEADAVEIAAVLNNTCDMLLPGSAIVPTLYRRFQPPRTLSVL
jgi:hypothetical protein